MYFYLSPGGCIKRWFIALVAFLKIRFRSNFLSISVFFKFNLKDFQKSLSSWNLGKVLIPEKWKILGPWYPIKLLIPNHFERKIKGNPRKCVLKTSKIFRLRRANRTRHYSMSFITINCLYFLCVVGGGPPEGRKFFWGVFGGKSARRAEFFLGKMANFL